MSRPFPPIGAPLALASLAALSLALSGCNATGAGRPGSLFGHGRGAMNQTRQPPSPDHPTKTTDPRDVSANPAPPRAAPIPGQGDGPDASAPQGVLPQPYANPPR